MAVVIETTAGDLTVDLFLDARPRACLNFLKLCKLKFYNYNLFHTIQHGFIAQTGDPTGAGDGGQSVWGILEGQAKRYFAADCLPKIRHSEPGLLSMVSLGDNMIGSQFFFTLGSDLTSLDETHCIIGQVTEGMDVLRILNEAICDDTHRPYQDIRITHTVVLEDPFENPRGFREISRSPSPSAERLMNGRIGADEEIDDTTGKTEKEINEMLQEREAKARATILEIVGDLPDADIAPPENVLFVCKLNPVTTDDDLEIIFSRFGKIKGCEVIRDRVTGDSLQYAFVEFEDQKACESAYFKMDNVLIDDRRIHVDFSQSVAKVQWKGKGRGLIFKDGNKSSRLNFDNLRDRNNEKPDQDFKQRDIKHKFPMREEHYRSMSPWRQDDRKSKDTQETDRNRSPRRYEQHSRDTTKYDRNRFSGYKRNDQNAKRRSRSPIKNRYRSKSPQRDSKNYRSRSRSAHRNYRKDDRVREIRRKDQREHNRSRSPVKVYKQTHSYNEYKNKDVRYQRRSRSFEKKKSKNRKKGRSSSAERRHRDVHQIKRPEKYLKKSKRNYSTSETESKGKQSHQHKHKKDKKKKRTKHKSKKSKKKSKKVSSSSESNSDPDSSDSSN